MSRTYHHGYKWAHKTRARCKHLLFDGETLKGEAFVGIATWNEPKWWRKTFKTRKRRAQSRSLCRKVLQEVDTESMTWPLDTKPWIYYW